MNFRFKLLLFLSVLCMVTRAQHQLGIGAGRNIGISYRHVMRESFAVEVNARHSLACGSKHLGAFVQKLFFITEKLCFYPGAGFEFSYERHQASYMRGDAVRTYKYWEPTAGLQFQAGLEYKIKRTILGCNVSQRLQGLRAKGCPQPSLYLRFYFGKNRPVSQA